MLLTICAGDGLVDSRTVGTAIATNRRGWRYWDLQARQEVAKLARRFVEAQPDPLPAEVVSALETLSDPASASDEAELALVQDWALVRFLSGLNDDFEPTGDAAEADRLFGLLAQNEEQLDPGGLRRGDAYHQRRFV